MFTPVAMKRGAFALLVASVLAGTAEAQTIPPDARRTCTCAGGAFTLAGGTASFHVTLDDYSSRTAVLVVMQFINQQGLVVKSKTVNIARGGSATLEFRGSGLYRARADALESASVYSSEETNLRASLEVSYDATPSDGSEYKRFIGPPIWFPCAAAFVL